MYLQRRLLQQDELSLRVVLVEPTRCSHLVLQPYNFQSSSPIKKKLCQIDRKAQQRLVLILPNTAARVNEPALISKDYCWITERHTRNLLMPALWPERYRINGILMLRPWYIVLLLPPVLKLSPSCYTSRIIDINGSGKPRTGIPM